MRGDAGLIAGTAELADRLSLFSVLFFKPEARAVRLRDKRLSVCVRIERALASSSSFDSGFIPGRFAVIQCGASTVTKQRGRHARPCSITRCCLSVSIYLSLCAASSRPSPSPPLLRSRAKRGVYAIVLLASGNGLPTITLVVPASAIFNGGASPKATDVRIVGAIKMSPFRPRGKNQLAV